MLEMPLSMWREQGDWAVVIVVVMSLDTSYPCSQYDSKMTISWSNSRRRIVESPTATPTSSVINPNLANSHRRSKSASRRRLSLSELQLDDAKGCHNNKLQQRRGSSQRPSPPKRLQSSAQRSKSQPIRNNQRSMMSRGRNSVVSSATTKVTPPPSKGSSSHHHQQQQQHRRTSSIRSYKSFLDA